MVWKLVLHGLFGPQLAPKNLATVLTWVECGLDADASAARLFVHPNTVRNRVGALAAATGLDPRDPFDAVTLWWLCRGLGAGGPTRGPRV